MAGRSIQALSKLLRRAQVSIPFSPNGLNTRFAPENFDGHNPLSTSLVEWRNGRNCGSSNSCSGPSLGFGGSLGPLAFPRSENFGKGALGLVSFSSLALETREDFRSNAAEIGYKVLGPYAPDGPKIKPQSAFAVVQVGAHQFKVTPGDMIYTEKLKYADINDQLSLNKVLLLGSSKQTVIGRPIIPDASVIAAVEEHALDAKVIVFKKKRRKNYRRTNGHRQELTRLRILRIEGIEESVPSRDEASSGNETD